MSIYSKTAAGWVEVAGGSSKAALSSWGRVVGEPEGAVTSAYINLEDGTNWQYWEFNTEGTYEIDLGNGGLFWVLCVGGGDGGMHDQNTQAVQGQPGLVNEGLWEFGPGTHTVTVGKMGTFGTGAGQLGMPSSIGDYGTQGQSNWGQQDTGRGAQSHSDPTGYVSSITGDPLQYATGQNGENRPGRGGSSGSGQRDGCVIIATRIDVEQLAPAPAELAPAPVLGAPVKVSGTADVVEYIVRQTDGTRKKIYMLPGNTTDNSDENVFEVALGAGVLPGVMVGAGGSGGFCNYASQTGGGGGAGGVIGTGCHVPVILPIQGEATYTVTVGSATAGIAVDSTWKYASRTTLAVQGQTPFACAVNGGHGYSISDRPEHICGTDGGSGGGGRGDRTFGSGHGKQGPGLGIPGQGHEGVGGAGMGSAASFGGGGYGSPPSQINGGAGFDLATALNLETSDGATAAFLAAVTVDGFIAGGGASRIVSSTTGTATAGGGSWGQGGKDYTGGGGSGSTGLNGLSGGCGAVYIITDA